MKFLFLAAVAILSPVVAHDHDDHSSQAPLEYVRFPFQPTYRNLDGEGESRTNYAWLSLISLRGSNGGRNFFWHHDIRQTAMGPVPYQREPRSF